MNKVCDIIKSMQKGFTVLYILVGLVILVVVVAGAYWLGISKNQLSPSQNQQVTGTVQPTITSGPNTTNSQLDIIPQANVLYIGTYEGVEAIFVTNSKLSEYFEAGVKKTNPSIGTLQKLEGSGLSPFDYKNLKDPKKILVLSNNVQQINNLKLSKDRISVYLSIMLETKTSNLYPDNLTNHIYGINLSNLISNDLWSHDLSPNKYKGASGAAYVKAVSDDNNYLVLSVFGCYACEGSEVGELVLNNQTKNEKYYEKIGNVQFNPSEGTFTYQKLAPFKEPCDPSPGCDSDNTRTVYKPSGQVFTEKLPL